MPPNTSTVRAIEKSTCGRRKANSSARSPPRFSRPPSRTSGTSVRMPISAMTPTALITQNVERQPYCCPSRVPSGTPRTLAVVRPANMIEIAPAFRSGATRFEASTAPMPKKAPWLSAATTRPAIMSE